MSEAKTKTCTLLDKSTGAMYMLLASLFRVEDTDSILDTRYRYPIILAASIEYRVVACVAGGIFAREC